MIEIEECIGCGKPIGQGEYCEECRKYMMVSTDEERSYIG